MRQVAMWLMAALACGHAVSDVAERQERMLQGALAYGREHWDAESGLVRDWLGHLNVAQCSLEYAVALLKSGGSGERIDKTLRAVVFSQDGNPGSSTYGGFQWYGGEPRRFHPDAVYFLTPWLVYIAQEWCSGVKAHGGPVKRETAELVRDTLPLSLHALRKGDPDPAETHKALLRAAGLIMAGQALGQDEAVTQGGAELEAWLDFTAEHGVGEYNSATNSVYSILAVQWIWQTARDEQLKSRAGLALEYLYRDLFLHYHGGSGCLAGPSSLSYDRDHLYGAGISRYLLYHQLGQPELEAVDPFAMVDVVQRYRPAERVLKIAREPQLPRTVRTRTVRRAGRNVRTCTYITAPYSLGTQSGEGTELQVPIFITYQTDNQRPTGFIRPAPNPTPLDAVQHESRALCCFTYGERELVGRGLIGWQGSLGPAEGLGELLIAGRPWDRQPVAVGAHTPLCGQFFDAYVAAIPLETEAQKVKDGVASREQPVRLSVEGGEVWLKGIIRQAKGLARGSRQPLRSGLALWLASSDEFPSLAAFAQAVGAAELVEQREGNIHTVQWSFPGGDTLELSHDLKELKVLRRRVNGKELGDEYLYLSPSMMLRPGQALQEGFVD